MMSPARTDASRVLGAAIAQALVERTRTAPQRWRTRFAPAPTGRLHLGHVVNALHVWGIANAHGGAVILRIEDHDRTRARIPFEHAMLEDLDWLGFAPDIGKTAEFRTGHTQYRQSDNLARYAERLHDLEQQRTAYPCVCTRREITALNASAVAAGTPEQRYPGTCRTRHVAADATPARRVRLGSAAERFDDLRLGQQVQRPEEECGDVLVRDRQGNFTYQFAVVVDDIDQQVDIVIRGEDLLASTGRQRQLARSLGQTTAPLYVHHALLMHADGRKLSKSLGDTGVSELRASGMQPDYIIGRAAHLAGLVERAGPLSVRDIGSLFAG